MLFEQVAELFLEGRWAWGVPRLRSTLICREIVGKRRRFAILNGLGFWGLAFQAWALVIRVSGLRLRRT